MIVNRSRSFRLIVIVSMLWPGCYRNPASMGTFLSSYHGDILMEFRQGTNETFNVTDPQAASRLVIPLPTASVSGDVLQSVSWVYKDATTGATLGGAPAYLTRIQLQIEGYVGGRIYDSPDHAPSSTSDILSSTVNWSNVSRFSMAYDDSLGNEYVVIFYKP
jgi:hypothetical protein